jgi:DNA-binding LacI/PurR family transcriptional regulator
MAEQVAQILREGLRQGQWRGTMPGRIKLAAELRVNHKTANAALRILEDEGILISRGPGREREIVATKEVVAVKLRVVILLFEPEDRQLYFIVDLRHRLEEAGHTAFFATKTLCELGMNVARVARMAEKMEADAWVIQAGSRDVLEWFASRPAPAFALFGRLMSVPLASTSPKKAGALLEMLERLVSLGHRRIVMLVREESRKPQPGYFERLFLDQLESFGISTSAYNLPDWNERPEELQQMLSSLFRHTPPTALIVGDIILFFAIQQHLTRLGFIAPEQVSLVCTDFSPHFEWCRPTIAHIAWDSNPVINRVVKWADNISRGKDDRRRTFSLAKFIDGGTIGPVPVTKTP